jgi:DHA1 family tetracycline resistance protein-like MFS transporter
MVTSSSDTESPAAARHDWQQWVEPWYLAYALLGVAAGGLVPILLPLGVNQLGGASNAGLVVAAFNLGGLAAPVWGGLADRYRLHRWLLAGGLLVASAGLAAFPFATSMAAWLGLALVQGIGVAGAATVANLFVVEAHPQAEWDERIGWLQTFYGGGQVVGLLLAGVLSSISLRVGLLAAAGVTAAAVLIAWPTTHTPPRPAASTPRPVLLHPARHGEWAVSSPQRLFHHLTRDTLRQLGPVMHSSFAVFLAVWLLTFGGAATVFALYPVLMQQVYGVAPGLSSAGFAVAAGLGLALYSPAGRWSERFGPMRVVRAALGVRLVAFLGLLGLGLTHTSGAAWLALLAFLFVVLAWSLLSVGGTALTARLSPVGEGEGMGIFNAVTALAGVVGAALGGWVAGQWGYNAVSGLAAAGVGLGLLLLLASSTSHKEGYIYGTNDGSRPNRA